MTVIPPEKATRFIDMLPVRKFFGVGKVTEEKMHSLGIRKGADLKRYSLEELDIPLREVWKLLLQDRPWAGRQACRLKVGEKVHRQGDYANGRYGQC